MFDVCKNTKKQGDVGLGSAIAWFCSEGYTVCIPLTDSQGYDLVVEDDERLYRVQVKTTSFKDKYGRFFTSLTVKGGNRTGTGRIKKFSKRSADMLFVLTSDGDRYLFLVEEEWNNQSLTLGEKYSNFKI